MRAPERIDGYAPIADYAAIGDGRSMALVGIDGSIDWLPLPRLDAPPALWRLLDAERGGAFVLQPKGAFHASRRYAGDSNVLETVFATPNGSVKVVELFNMDGGALLPWAELVRKVECLDGEVELEWRLSARPKWGEVDVRASIRDDVAVVEWDEEGIAVLSYDAGEPKVDGTDVHGSFTLKKPDEAMLAALYFEGEPFAAPPQAELALRVDRTLDYWQTYTREIPYDGPWQHEVRRSVLAQRLLTDALTGAIAAAATTSLPERVGGDRNWDYRFSWIRDTALALESLLVVRLTVECHRSFAWVIKAAQETAPNLQPMYTLAGSPDLPRLDVDIDGYRGSRPVRVGNDAQDQLQLGGYGDAIDAAFRYCGAGHVLNEKTAALVAALADEVCKRWQEPGAGIWEMEPRQYTQSKMACWSALDRAIELADTDKLPRDNEKTWQRSRKQIREWIEENCWSDTRGAYVCYPGAEGLDASVLLAPRLGYSEPGDERFLSTLAAIREELCEGPFMYRYSDARGVEGCFLPCSFWLVDVLARVDRVDEARQLMEELLDASSDVGLYAEEIDPKTREHLGNTPQALTHLSLILAAVSVMKAEQRQVRA